MITEKELRREYKAVKKEYWKALKKVNKLAKRRNIDDSGKALLDLQDARVTISTLEYILEIPYEELFLPL